MLPEPFLLHFDLSGGKSERATPVPIPNTVVKSLSADGTARGTLWESRTLPGFSTKKGSYDSIITPLFCV